MIYLDNAATTRPSEGALARAQHYLTECYYNPSALYGGGAEAARLLGEARAFLLSRIADPARFSLTFTSCGTEADNQAIFSAARRGNAVTTAGEHAAVSESFKELKNRGVEPRFAPLHKDGSVDEEGLLRLVDEKTTLVSVIHVSNETGAVNDIASLARRVKERAPRALFMSDGVQAYGKIPFRLSKDIDLYTVSAHKIGGLKGTGALIRNKSYAGLCAHLHGGGQEGGLRSGTENTSGIAGMVAAVQSYPSDGMERMRSLKKLLLSLLTQALPETTVAGLPVDDPMSAGHILNVAFPPVRAETLLHALEADGICVGTGSACSSKKGRRSPVLTAMHLPPQVMDSAIRISLCPFNTEEEMRYTAEKIIERVGQLRRFTRR